MQQGDRQVTEVTIPTGQSRDGWIWISANGVEQWIRAGVPTDVSTSHISVLNDAGIDYTGGLTAPGGTTDTIVINFKDGIYSVNGGATTINDLTDEDIPNWNTYDPADIVPGSGYPSLGAGPILIGAAATAVLDGATMVVDFDVVDDTIHFAIFEPTFVTDYRWEPKSLIAAHRVRYTDNLNFTDSPVVINNGHHKIAITQLYTTMAMSIDGNVVELFTPREPDPLPTLVGFYLDGGGASFIRSINIMPPQLDVDLPALSAL